MLKMMFAAPSSDSGKTSVTCGMLSLLAEMGLDPVSFKCGPDYIDPMFHRSVLGVSSHNIDLFMCEKERAKEMAERYMKGHGAAVFEGVMGYYDGVSGKDLKASACDVAETLDVPVILVVRPKGSALTLAAVIKGMAEFRKPTKIKGVILNDCQEMIYKAFRDVYEGESGIPVLGYIPHIEGAEFKSRHLGLYTAGEIDDIRERIGKIRDAMKKGIDMDRLAEVIGEDKENDEKAPAEDIAEDQTGALGDDRPVIAVARDEAFSFIYEETLDTLEDHGAKIKEFSPVHDEKIPEDAGALYIPGGYPELYAEALSKNASMLASVKEAAGSGMPLIAECGGFLYLGEKLTDSSGKTWDMAGVLPGTSRNGGRLMRFGYSYLTSDKDNMLIKKGEKIPVHEFHYWDSTDNGKDLVSIKAGSERSFECGFAGDTMYAGFPHLYMAGYPEAAERFIEQAKQYRTKRKGL